MKSRASRLDHKLIGESAPMKALNRHIRTAADCNLTVLICGESGTGKELVARAIHSQSARTQKPFVAKLRNAYRNVIGIGALRL